MPDNPYAGAAKRVTPDTMRRREAPAEDVPIRHDRRRQDKRYGKPKSYRLPPEFIKMLNTAGEKWGVPPKEIIQLAVCEYVTALEAGKVQLPIASKSEKRQLQLPPIPHIK